jgi:acetylornithine deacetylase/succinyl-diaminopimelate desuccinylase-like protein
MLQAGIAPNVVPGEARGVVNIRLLPGNLLQPLLGKLQQAVHDPAVRFEPRAAIRPPAPSSSLTSDLYKAISDAAGRDFPGAAVLPYMSTGATDSAFLRMRQVEAYGLLPFPMPEEDSNRMHADNERIQLDSFRKGFEFLYHIVTDFVVSK